MIKVKKTKIIGTNCLLFSAWEPSAVMGRHHSITTIEGSWWGRVGTDCLPAEIDALPAYSQERSDAVRAWFAKEEERAYAAIVAAYPEAAYGLRRSGEIEIW